MSPFGLSSTTTCHTPPASYEAPGPNCAAVPVIDPENDALSDFVVVAETGFPVLDGAQPMMPARSRTREPHHSESFDACMLKPPPKSVPRQAQSDGQRQSSAVNIRRDETSSNLAIRTSRFCAMNAHDLWDDAFVIDRGLADLTLFRNVTPLADFQDGRLTSDAIESTRRDES